MDHYTDFQTLLYLTRPQFQDVIEREYGFILASVIKPKEYDVFDIQRVEHFMPSHIKLIVFELDYQEMTDSPTSWKALWEYFEN